MRQDPDPEEGLGNDGDAEGEEATPEVTASESGVTLRGFLGSYGAYRDRQVRRC